MTEKERRSRRRERCRWVGEKKSRQPVKSRSGRVGELLQRKTLVSLETGKGLTTRYQRNDRQRSFASKRGNVGEEGSLLAKLTSKQPQASERVGSPLQEQRRTVFRRVEMVRGKGKTVIRVGTGGEVGGRRKGMERSKVDEPRVASFASNTKRASERGSKRGKRQADQLESKKGAGEEKRSSSPRAATQARGGKVDRKSVV